MSEPLPHWTELRDPVWEYQATLYLYLDEPPKVSAEELDNDRQAALEAACLFVSLNHPNL